MTDGFAFTGQHFGQVQTSGRNRRSRPDRWARSHHALTRGSADRALFVVLAREIAFGMPRPRREGGEIDEECYRTDEKGERLKLKAWAFE